MFSPTEKVSVANNNCINPFENKISTISLSIGIIPE